MAPETTSRPWHDEAIAGLSGRQRDAIAKADLPWLNSLGFCMIYEQAAAQRVRWIEDDAGKIARAAFYREQSWLGVIRVIEFVGYNDLSEAEVKAVLAERRGKIAVINRMLPAETPDRPYQPSGTSELFLAYNVIADLPATKEAYLAALGKQKRQQLPRYWRRLEREYPSAIEWRVTEGPSIKLEDILTLVRFNQTRMAAQGRGDHTAEETARQKRRLPLTQIEGLLCEVRIAGVTVAGTLNFVHGSEAFLIVPAHDPTLEHLNLGNLCLWRTIEHLIERGVTRYHLFWGKKEYKTQFLGKDHPVVAQIICPSPLLMTMWRGRMIAQRQGPRALRFAMRTVLSRFSRKRIEPEVETQLEGEGS